MTKVYELLKIYRIYGNVLNRKYCGEMCTHFTYYNYMLVSL